MLSALRRSVESFILALVLLRLTGRKSISQLNYFDFLTVNMIGGLLSSYIADSKQNPEVLLAPMAIIALDLLADRTAIKSRPARKLLEGKPVVFIENGKIIEKNIKKMHYNIAEVLAALRNEGIYNLSEVEFAVLEIDGKISVLKKSQHRSLTPKDINVPTQYEGLPSVIVNNGKIMSENLRNNNLDRGWLENKLKEQAFTSSSDFRMKRSWLENKLKEQGVNDISRIFLASLPTDGSLYIDLKDGLVGNTTPIPLV